MFACLVRLSVCQIFFQYLNWKVVQNISVKNKQMERLFIYFTCKTWIISVSFFLLLFSLFFQFLCFRYTVVGLGWALSGLKDTQSNILFSLLDWNIQTTCWLSVFTEDFRVILHMQAYSTVVLEKTPKKVFWSFPHWYL